MCSPLPRPGSSLDLRFAEAARVSRAAQTPSPASFVLLFIIQRGRDGTKTRPQKEANVLMSLAFRSHLFRQVPERSNEYK